MIYELETHKHIGDHVILTGAVRNVRAVYPDIKFSISTDYAEIFENNRDFVIDTGVRLPRITYGTLYEEQRALNGNLVEGFTKSLCKAIGVEEVKPVTKTPYIVLTDEEKERAKKWNGKWLVNATFQTCGVSKGYPWWEFVISTLNSSGLQLVQIGGNESRDISCNLDGVLDMRGKTSIRDLITMIYGCEGIITPPSCSMNIGAAFGKKMVVIVGGRELPQLSGYENVTYIEGHCDKCGWGNDARCVSLRFYGSRACNYFGTIDGLQWCDCMINVEPHDITDAVLNA